jgi:hypothetical protein
MTRPVTRSDVLNRATKPPQQGDSPSARAPARRAPARARVTATDRKRKMRTLAASWWVWTDRPPSLRATWRLSKVDPVRVPAKSGPLTLLWRISNVTDRPILFALTILAPSFLAGPLRWLTARPTRRFGLYFLLLTFVVYLVAGR